MWEEFFGFPDDARIGRSREGLTIHMIRVEIEKDCNALYIRRILYLAYL